MQNPQLNAKATNHCALLYTKYSKVVLYLGEIQSVNKYLLSTVGSKDSQGYLSDFDESLI